MQAYQLLQVQVWVAVCFFFYKIEEAGKYLQLPVFIGRLHDVFKQTRFPDDFFKQLLKRNIGYFSNQ
jgi:hypothetical protein